MSSSIIISSFQFLALTVNSLYELLSMPLLDIAIAEPSIWNPPGVQPSLIGKATSNATFRYWKILTPSWIAFRKQNFPGNCNRLHGKSLIKVVTSPDARSPVHCEDAPQPSDGVPPCPGPLAQTLITKSSSEASEEIDERELLRRMRISKANSGKIPWNKGRKHSAETIQRIKERTWLAMQNPKVKVKIKRPVCIHLSEETKKKIAKSLQVGRKKRREMLMVQETCYFQWQNLIAEAARGGFAGEEELQWDSYDILNKQLEQEWLENKEKRKLDAIKSRKGPKSLEQRRKISAAIAAKWADPEYRERVNAGISKHRASIAGTERIVRSKPSSPRPRKERKEKEVKKSVKSIQIEEVKKTQLPGSKKEVPSYEDPLSLSKLEMIKNIRAQRVASDMKRYEALEKAKLLIMEAEKAANTLEAAATRSPIARASLIESKKLIAEAVQSIRSIENAQVQTIEPSSGLKAFPENEVEVTEAFPYSSSARHQELIDGNSGTPGLESSQMDSANFNLYMLDSVNGRNNNLPTSFKSDQLLAIGQNENGLKQLLDQPVPTSGSDGNGKPVSDKTKTPSRTGKSLPKSATSTKRWVRGRLVEVVEGE